MDASANSLDPDGFLQLLSRHLKLLGNPAALTMQSNLYELGLDSTGALGLLLELEETFGIVFPESLLTDATFETPSALHASLVTLVRAQRPGSGPT